MNCFDETLVAFRGIDPKPPSPPTWLHLLKQSSDYGAWRTWDTGECYKKMKKRKGKKSHGKQ